MLQSFVAMLQVFENHSYLSRISPFILIDLVWSLFLYFLYFLYLLYFLYFLCLIYFLCFNGIINRIAETITQSHANQSPNRA